MLLKIETHIFATVSLALMLGIFAALLWQSSERAKCSEVRCPGTERAKYYGKGDHVIVCVCYPKKASK